MAKVGQATVQLVTLYKCPDCEKIFDQDEATENGPLYECGECGEVFTRANSANDNHQCPSCNKFASKLSEFSCPDECSSEPEEIEGLEYEGTIYLPKEED